MKKEKNGFNEQMEYIQETLKNAKRFKLKEVPKEQYRLFHRPPYYNKEEFKNRFPILIESLMREGQVIPIVTNRNPDTGMVHVLFDWVVFEKMNELGFDSILVHEFSLERADAIKLFEELNLSFSRFSTDIEEDIIGRRIEEAEAKVEQELSTALATLGVTEAAIRPDKAITYFKISSSEPKKKVMQQLLSKIKERKGMKSNDAALMFALKTVNQQLKDQQL